MQANFGLAMPIVVVALVLDPVQNLREILTKVKRRETDPLLQMRAVFTQVEELQGSYSAGDLVPISQVLFEIAKELVDHTTGLYRGKTAEAVFMPIREIPVKKGPLLRTLEKGFIAQALSSPEATAKLIAGALQQEQACHFLPLRMDRTFSHSQGMEPCTA